MGKSLAKTRRMDAEMAAVHCLHEHFGCVTTRRAIRTQFQSVDFFASDVMGKRKHGSMVFAQVTAGQSQAVRQRRRKLEKIPWQATDTVLVLQMVETPNPANAKRKDFWFRVHELNSVSLGWRVRNNAIPVPRTWFKKRKET